MLTDPTKLRKLADHLQLWPTVMSDLAIVELRLIADRLEALEDSWADIVTLVNDRPKAKRKSPHVD